MMEIVMELARMGSVYDISGKRDENPYGLGVREESQHQ